MAQNELLDKLSKEVSDFLSEPIGSEAIVPKAERVIEFLKQVSKDMPALERYRQVRERMGSKSEEFIVPPNFTYQLHTG